MQRLGLGLMLLALAANAAADGPESKAYGHSEIRAQLNAIRLARVEFDGAPLDAVFRWLIAEAGKAEYPRRSLNLLGPNLEGVTVMIQPPMERASLREVLDAVARGASPSIAYRVENYGVVFFRGEMPATEDMLSKRMFKLRSGIFDPDLTASEQTDGMREFIAAHGIDCRPPFQLFFNGRLSHLWVRAKPNDLNRIESILQDLLAAAKRLRLELRFAEVPAGAAPVRVPDLSLDTGVRLGRFSTPGSEPNGIFTYERTRDGDDISHRLSSPSYAVTSGIVDESEFAAILNTLQSKAGVDVLSFPTWTGGDNEPTTFRVGTSVPTGTGPSASVHPKVAVDEKSIHVAITAAVSELIGYASQLPWHDTSGPGNSIMRLRQMSDQFDLAIGQTAVLGIGPATCTQTGAASVPVLGELPYVGHLFRFETKTKVEKNLWLFLTPRWSE